MISFAKDRIDSIPWTAWKIEGARFLRSLLSPFLPQEKIVKRNGIFYELELDQGLDFSVYLQIGFQKHVLTALPIAPHSVILDVGANIGSMTLPFAKAAIHGKVHSFEPTDELFRRLQINVKLNPDLAPRIHLNRLRISNQNRSKQDFQIYSRWPLYPRPQEKHPIHWGMKTVATQVETWTLDEYVNRKQLDRVDLIKIDVDGTEYAVLCGAMQTLARFSPVVIFEVGQYLLEEHQISFGNYLTFFSDLNYHLRDLKTGQWVTSDNWYRIIPKNCTTDLQAIPSV